MNIKAIKDIYNGGKCFTSGNTYEVINLHQTHTPQVNAGLIDKIAINDQGEKHCIGSWWRNFQIINK